MNLVISCVGLRLFSLNGLSSCCWWCVLKDSIRLF